MRTPCSPHRPAELDGLEIDVERLVPPTVEGPLVIEGASGVRVPVTRETLFADLFARWRLPVVLVARTGLGTINHSLKTPRIVVGTCRQGIARGRRSLSIYYLLSTGIAGETVLKAELCDPSRQPLPPA